MVEKESNDVKSKIIFIWCSYSTVFCARWRCADRHKHQKKNETGGEIIIFDWAFCQLLIWQQFHQRQNVAISINFRNSFCILFLGCEQYQWLCLYLFNLWWFVSQQLAGWLYELWKRNGRRRKTTNKQHWVYLAWIVNKHNHYFRFMCAIAFIISSGKKLR